MLLGGLEERRAMVGESGQAATGLTLTSPHLSPISNI